MGEHGSALQWIAQGSMNTKQCLSDVTSRRDDMVDSPTAIHVLFIALEKIG